MFADSKGIVFRILRIKIVCILFLCSCTTLVVHNHESKNKMVIGSRDISECRIVAFSKKRYALWGLIPLTRNELPDYDIQSERSYKILQKISFIDGVITVIGGFLATITQVTVEIHECDEPYIVINAVEEKKKAEAEKERILSEYLIFISKNPSLQAVPVFVMNDKTINMGKIVEITNDSIIIEYSDKTAIKESSRQNESDTVLLKTGAVIKGQIVGQDGNSVVIFDGVARKTLHKSEIKRIMFRSESATDQYEISNLATQQTFIRKELKRSDIKKILLNQRSEGL